MTTKKPASPLLQIAIDLGPLLVFFVTFSRTDVFTATIAFMIAMVAAIGVSYFQMGRVSPMLLFSAFMVLVLGGLTVWLHDATFIKIKPTIYYGTVAAILGFGFATRRPTLKSVLGNAYPELSDDGWHLLGRNFAFFFLAMAILNEMVWRNSSTGFWLGFKLWGALPLTLLFGAANLPMILKHSRPTDHPVDPPVPPAG